MNILNISRVLSSLCTLSCFDCSWSFPQWNDRDEMKFSSVQTLKRSNRPNRKLSSRTPKCSYSVCSSLIFVWNRIFCATIRTQRCRLLHIVTPKNYKISQTEKGRKKNELIFTLTLTILTFSLRSQTIR